MPTPLIPQEIFLLERFCSLEYFGKMRDAWADMLKYAEDYLQRFMLNLPPDYRSRERPYQPDITWGECVLPNFRDTMRVLNDGYIMLSHGDLTALNRACGVTGDFRGLRQGFSEEWMDEVEPGAADKFSDLITKATHFAWPISRTSSGIWSEGNLTIDYDEVVRSPLNPPPTWPIYRLNPNVTVTSGGRTSKAGIYLPDIDHGFPTLLTVGEGLDGEANEASVSYSVDPSGYLPTTWTLVERIADSGGGIPGTETVITQTEGRLRCEAKHPCPQTGWWFTPAKADSRRHFKQGETMPEFQTDYGMTVWYWDGQQE